MKFDKNDRIAIIGTIVFHVAIFIILFFTVIKSIVPEEEDGVLVNFGNMNDAAGIFEPQGTGTPVQDAVTVPENIPPPQPSRTTPEEMVTQDMEETVSLTDKKKEEERRREEERLEKERQAQAEQRRREEEQRRREQAIRDQVAGAFGSGNADGSQGDATTGTGNQGNPFGNSNTGPTEGVGGFGGSFNLNGRTLRGGGLPSPAYTSQVEGRIVIEITVNPRGNVINAVIGKGTNIDDAPLRKSAIEAARQAQFNSIQGINNQSGTITYRYSLK